MKEVQLDLFLTTEASRINHEIQEYKKKTQNSIRGLFARHKELKDGIAEINNTLREFFQIDISLRERKTVIFESDVESVIQSSLDEDKVSQNAEFQEYRYITEKSMTALKYKCSESERMLLDIKSFLDNIVFKEMESRAHAS